MQQATLLASTQLEARQFVSGASGVQLLAPPNISTLGGQVVIAMIPNDAEEFKSSVASLVGGFQGAWEKLQDFVGTMKHRRRCR